MSRKTKLDRVRYLEDQLQRVRRQLANALREETEAKARLQWKERELNKVAAGRITLKRDFEHPFGPTMYAAIYFEPEMMRRDFLLGSHGHFRDLTEYVQKLSDQLAHKFRDLLADYIRNGGEVPEYARRA